MAAYFLDRSALVKRYVRVTADNDLLAAGAAEGLTTDNPNSH